ncbi:MAG TPA: APC family permease [Chthoniobacterales bacterium]|jgi:amino acid transporter|nr:APC family permease [Chthoniobacterales bacterium]
MWVASRGEPQHLVESQAGISLDSLSRFAHHARVLGEPEIEIQQAERTDEKLVRGIGIPALTANIVSSTIGAGIFVIPATVAKGLGSAAPLAFVCCAFAMILFVTCFAIAGSRVSLTGGLYAYVEVAFGRYVGFLAGMLYFLTALGAVAGVVNVLANSVALVVPFLGSPAMRIVVMLAVYGSLVLINIRGVRQGAGAVTVITVAKLLPLLLFIGAGLLFVQAPNLTWSGWPTSKSLGDSVVLLMFAFVGIEVALIPSGEVKNPARTVPRSAYLALVVTTIIYVLIQVVAQGTLGGDLANHPDAPLAESAARFLGNIGGTILLAGATISAFGFVTSDILSSPRMVFAFGRDGALPKFFAHVHPRYRSPDVAIITYATLAFALSVSGTFEQLAVLSNVAVLLMYFLCCAGCWVLIRRDVRTDAAKPGINFPGMKIVPALAIIAIIWILAHASIREFAVTGAVLVVASVFYLARVQLRRKS